MHDFIKRTRIAGGLAAATFLGAAAFAMLSAPVAMAQEKAKRSGPPPKVFTELPNKCARCHKSDGRGGPAYGGFAADLRATELDQEGLAYIITVGIRDRGMPEFKSVLSKREIAGIATYIDERIKGVYFDENGNQITAEEAAALDAADN
jgi:mono/diheme cytochrome c family protein